MLQLAATVALSCHYSGLNDPFCCKHHSRLSMLFTGSDNPKIAHYRWGILTPSNTWSLGPSESASQTAGISINSAICAQHICVTNTQTTLHVTSVAIGHIYALHTREVAWILIMPVICALEICQCAKQDSALYVLVIGTRCINQPIHIFLQIN